MDSLTKILDDAFAMPQYVLEVGVLTHNNKRRKVEIGMNNAQLMFIHENGSPLRGLPARPVLQMTIDWANSSGLVASTLSEMFDVYLKTENEANVDRIVKKLCLKLQNYARNIIYSNDGRLAPNAPSVAKRKKGNHPLFDTGQLARSITCTYIKLNRKGEVINESKR